MPKPDIEQRNGGYYLTGNRISLDSIVAFHLQGQTPEQIAGGFETPVEQILGAIDFYLANREAVDRLIAQAEQRFEAWKATQPPLPEDLRQRLNAARTRSPASRR